MLQMIVLVIASVKQGQRALYFPETLQLQALPARRASSRLLQARCRQRQRRPPRSPRCNACSLQTAQTLEGCNLAAAFRACQPCVVAKCQRPAAQRSTADICSAAQARSPLACRRQLPRSSSLARQAPRLLRTLPSWSGATRSCRPWQKTMATAPGRRRCAASGACFPVLACTAQLHSAPSLIISIKFLLYHLRPTGA